MSVTRKYSWGTRWVTKYKTKEFGYKDHVSVDQKSKVINRAYRNKSLTNKQHKLNHKHSKTRVRVEHIFGTLKTSMNNALSLKAIGLQRIKSITGLLNLTYNLLRYEQLVRLKNIPIMKS